jgi:hypothetical protein
MLSTCLQRSNIAKHALFLTLRVHIPPAQSKRYRSGIAPREVDDKDPVLPTGPPSGTGVPRLVSREDKIVSRNDFFKVSAVSRVS